jgi:hypothetical protein
MYSLYVVHVAVCGHPTWLQLHPYGHQLPAVPAVHTVTLLADSAACMHCRPRCCCGCWRLTVCPSLR